MLQNLVVSRTEVNNFTDSLKWSPNGELAVNATDRISFLKPKYLNLPQEQLKGTKELFVLELAKHADLSMDNFFFKSELNDERVNSVFVNSETSIVKFDYSPLTKSQSTYLAILTNKGTLMILKDRKFFQKFNKDEVFTTQAEFNEWKFETFEWVLSNNNNEEQLSIVVSLKSGSLEIYKLDDSEESFKLSRTLPNVSKSPVSQIKSYNDTLFLINDENEIIFHDGSTSRTLLSDNSFQIYDFIKVNDFLIFSTPTKLHKLSLTDNKVVNSIDIGYYHPTRFHLIGLNDILVTLINCFKTNSFKLKIDAFETVDDDLIAPVIKKKLSKWNKKFNDFKKKDPVCKLYGMAFNYNKTMVCFLYEIKNRLTLQYTIESETSLQVELLVLPKDKNFKLSENRGSSLAVYQHYQITRDFELLQGILSSNPADDFNDIDYTLPFDRFLNESILKNRLFHDDSVKAIIEKNQGAIKDIQYYFAKLVLNYIETNKVNVESEFDRFMLNNYCLATNQSLMFPDATKWSCILLQSFTESFDLKKQVGGLFDPRGFTSEEGHSWLRCSITLFPLLTGKILVDPIFEEVQIININAPAQDLELYQIGNIGSDVLRVLSKISLFSGGIFQEPS